MFSAQQRCVYQNNQLAQVICQLRFPEILTISTTLPAQFQEAIRGDFPRYQAVQEKPAPKVIGAPGGYQVENQPGTINYSFASEDGVWRVNLTSKFISLSTSKYTTWEEFASKLDKPLATFISVYKPAYFERVGLRYINIFSRKELDLEVPFRELFHSRYLGILSDEEVQETGTSRCSVDAEFNIRGGCRVKLHAGPGLVKKGNVSDGELKFIFDQDLYMPGNIQVNLSAGALQTLHGQAFAIFRGAITDKLHEAMEPESI